MFVCVSVCCLHGSTLGGQSRASDPLELALQVAVSHPTWCQGPNISHPKEQQHSWLPSLLSSPGFSPSVWKYDSDCIQYSVLLSISGNWSVGHFRSMCTILSPVKNDSFVPAFLGVFPPFVCFSYLIALATAASAVLKRHGMRWNTSLLGSKGKRSNPPTQDCFFRFLSFF